MISFQDRAIELLNHYRKAPRMFARDREAFLCMVMAVLNFVKIDKGINDLCKKYWGTYGNSYINLDTPVDDEWANALLDESIVLIIKSDIII